MWRYFDMDNALQVLLTLLSLLAAVVQLNSAFYNVTSAYMHKRQAIIQVNCNSSRVQRCHQHYTDSLNGVVVLEKWQENFHVQISPDLREKLHPCGRNNNMNALY